MEAIYKNN